MLGSCKPNPVVKARPEVPGTDVFEQMFVASRKQFVAMAYSILRNTEDAEDAVQNAFISGYLHLRNFQGRSALKTWFTRVVLNAALMIRRKRKPVQLVSAPEWATEKINHTHTNVGDFAEQNPFSLCNVGFRERHNPQLNIAWIRPCEVYDSDFALSGRYSSLPTIAANAESFSTH
jgi:RNA polymerase sigma factor (sigma-70 family)